MVTSRDDSAPPGTITPAPRRSSRGRGDEGEASRLQAQLARFGFRGGEPPTEASPPSEERVPVAAVLAAVIPSPGTQVVQTARAIEGSPGVVRIGFDLPGPPPEGQVTALWLRAAADPGVQVESLALECGGRVDVIGDALDASGPISLRVAVDARPRFGPDARLWVTCRFATGGVGRIGFGDVGVEVVRWV